MAVLPLAKAQSVEMMVEHAIQQGREAPSMNQYPSLSHEAEVHLGCKNKSGVSFGMNPSMEHIYLPEFHQAMYNHRTIEGKEQALISVMEYPNPPTYPTLDVEGLVAHGIVQKWDEGSGEAGWIRTVRKKMFQEAGLYVPMALFDKSLLPEGLPFTHGPFPIPTKPRYVY
jgi:hypothetical protein